MKNSLDSVKKRQNPLMLRTTLKAFSENGSQRCRARCGTWPDDEEVKVEEMTGRLHRCQQPCGGIRPLELYCIIGGGESLARSLNSKRCKYP